MKKSFLFFATILSGLVACQKEKSVGEIAPISEEVSKAVLYSEVANLIGETNNASSAYQLARMIQESGDPFETLSLESILSAMTKSGDNAGFAMDLLDNLNNNPDKYPSIFRQLNVTKSFVEDLSVLNSLDVEFYMPNCEEFDLESIDKITLSYDPVVRDDYSDGYRYDLVNGSKEFIAMIDESYMEANPTILVLPKDNTEYTPSLTSSEIPDGLLTQNVTNSALIREQDILYTTVQSIRVNQSAKSWCGTISKQLKLAIYRASGDVVFLDNGELQASGSCHKPILIAIPKKNIKNSTWYDNVNYLFDDDWDLHEYNQKIFFASEHNVGQTTANITTDVGIGYKDSSFTADLGFNVTAEVVFANHSQLRQHNELTRASMLATNVGMPNSRNGFTVRSYGPIDIVFNFYYTRIDDQEEDPEDTDNSGNNTIYVGTDDTRYRIDDIRKIDDDTGKGGNLIAISK